MGPPPDPAGVQSMRPRSTSYLLKTKRGPLAHHKAHTKRDEMPEKNSSAAWFLR